MKTSDYAKLSLKKKEDYWTKAFLNRCDEYGELSVKQWEYEFDRKYLMYQDDFVTVEKKYGNLIIFGRTDESAGIEAGSWILFEGDMGEILDEEKYKGMTFIDYMREKGFPLTFDTWI